MEWQVLAIVVVVLTTLIWFVRDERRLRADARLARAARYYAHAPKYRFVPRSDVQAPAPRPRAASLLRTDRAFFDRFLSERAGR